MGKSFFSRFILVTSRRHYSSGVSSICYELNLYITLTVSQQLLHSQVKAFFFALWPRRSERMHPWHDARLYIPGRTTVRHVEIPPLWPTWIPVQGSTEAAWRYWHTAKSQSTYTLSKNSRNAACTDVPVSNRQICSEIIFFPTVGDNIIINKIFLLFIHTRSVSVKRHKDLNQVCSTCENADISALVILAQHEAEPLGKHYPLL